MIYEYGGYGSRLALFKRIGISKIELIQNKIIVPNDGLILFLHGNYDLVVANANPEFCVIKYDGRPESISFDLSRRFIQGVGLRRLQLFLESDKFCEIIKSQEFSKDDFFSFLEIDPELEDLLKPFSLADPFDDFEKYEEHINKLNDYIS